MTAAVKKILIVTPRFPLPDAGACEQDRLEGIKQLKRLGFDVRVLAKIFQFQDQDAISRFSREFNILVTLVDYENEKKRTGTGRVWFYTRRFLFPPYWDGAAYEYSHKSVRSAFARIVGEWKPDIVWFDYPYCWPLYSAVKRAGISIVTRSINFEPVHFLQEDGYSFLNIIRSLPKLLSELLVTWKSDWVFAITPHEEKIYRRLGARRISTLPLRSLPKVLAVDRAIVDKQKLDVFFAGSTYTVSHNRKALEFIIREIIPRVERSAPGIFTFHITGAKLSARIVSEFPLSAVYHGFVGDWEGFLGRMDIAIVPSLFGAGMQQKFFEPLARGIPTVASVRGLVDYPFRHGEQLWTAKTMDDFIEGLLALRDVRIRKRFSKNAIRTCQIFSQNALDAIIQRVSLFHHVRD